MNLKATEKTQSVLREFLEPVFCEISLATFNLQLYTQDFQVATVVELKIPPDFHFLGVCLSFSVGIRWL